MKPMLEFNKQRRDGPGGEPSPYGKGPSVPAKIKKKGKMPKK